MESKSFPFNCDEGWSHSPNIRVRNYTLWRTGGGSGVCMDYRYMNEDFVSKQGTANSTWFDAKTNKEFLDYAKEWGFTNNYISPQKGVWKNLTVNGRPIKKHENHGHLTYNI